MKSQESSVKEDLVLQLQIVLSVHQFFWFPIFNQINEKMRHSQCYYRENNLARNTWVEALVVRDNKQ